MSDPIVVFVNASGGAAKRLGDDCAGAVQRAFASAGREADVRLVDGAGMTAAVTAEVIPGKMLVVGGGDGTLGGAAGPIAAAGGTLGILPLGTRNHLARELGIPPDLEGAARLIAAGATRRIDLGQVNGRSFVNNASIGLYPRLVRMREEVQARGWPKWAAAVRASAAALKRLRHHRLRLAMPDAAQEVLTPMLFVGNNRYALEPGRVGQRDALDDGTLAIYAVAQGGRAALVGMALRTLLGRADPARDFAALGDVRTLTVEGHARTIAIALDGERTRLPLPLRFESLPRALSVIAPA